jgi:hypothetical protein
MLIEEVLTGNGLNSIWNYDNIAIIVTMICLLLSMSMNIMLIKGLLKIKDIINKLVVMISVLNEKLDRL